MILKKRRTAAGTELLIGAPMTGKTETMFRLSANTGNPIVTMTAGLADNFVARAMEMGITTMPRPVTYAALKAGEVKGAVIIDNLDDMLRELCPNKVTTCGIRESRP